MPWKVHSLEHSSQIAPFQSNQNYKNEALNSNITHLVIENNRIYFASDHKNDHKSKRKHEMPMVESIIKLMERLHQLNMTNMSALNYFYPYRSPLTLYPVLNDTNVTRILLVSYFRSGSSFLGELLQQNTRSFYSYEPLHYMTDGTRIPDERADEALHLLDSIYHCNFSDHYTNWAKRTENQFLFRWNRFLWGFCRIRPHLCFDANFVNEVCIRSPIHVIKVNRVNMRYVEKLINSSNYGDKIKIVYLVRDPRAIYSSRKSKLWCNGTSCSNISVLCKQMNDDLMMYKQMKQQIPDRIHLIRYEDLSMHAMSATKSLFQKLNIKFTDKVRRYLFTHTNLPKSVHENADPYSTRRNSKQMPYQWTHLVDFDEINELQSKCTFLSQLGYKSIDIPPIEVNNLTQILAPINL